MCSYMQTEFKKNQAKEQLGKFINSVSNDRKLFAYSLCLNLFPKLFFLRLFLKPHKAILDKFPGSDDIISQIYNMLPDTNIFFFLKYSSTNIGICLPHTRVSRKLEERSSSLNACQQHYTIFLFCACALCNFYQ